MNVVAMLTRGCQFVAAAVFVSAWAGPVPRLYRWVSRLCIEFVAHVLDVAIASELSVTRVAQSPVAVLNLAHAWPPGQAVRASRPTP